MPNALANFVDIRTNLLADVRHLVDETDLGGQHAVGCILDHLGTFNTHHNKRLLGSQERLVQFLHQFRCGGIVNTHDHAIGFGEVVYGSALLQEFRVGSDAEASGGFGGNPAGDFAIGTHRNRALADDHGIVTQIRSHLLGG